jgi:hypothetical protein
MVDLLTRFLVLIISPYMINHLIVRYLSTKFIHFFTDDINGRVTLLITIFNPTLTATELRTKSRSDRNHTMNPLTIYPLEYSDVGDIWAVLGIHDPKPYSKPADQPNNTC